MAHRVALGVEPHRLPAPLHPAQRQRQRQPDADAPQDEPHGLQQEYPPDAGVGGPKRLEDADGGPLLENHDQQRRHDGDGADDAHDGEDEGDVGIQQVEPREERRVLLHDGAEREVVGQFGQHGGGGGVEAGQVGDQQLVAAHLPGRPVAEALHLPQVAHHDEVVHLGEVGAVDAANGEGACPRRALLPEVGAHLVAHRQPQLRGQRGRDGHLVAGGAVRQVRQPARREARGEERRVAPRADAAQHDAVDLLAGLHHAALGGIVLHVAHARHSPQPRRQRAVHLQGGFLVVGAGREVGHRDMAAETRHLAGNLALEAAQDTHRHDHHQHAQRDAGHGDGRQGA